MSTHARGSRQRWSSILQNITTLINEIISSSWPLGILLHISYHAANNGVSDNNGT